MNLFVFSKFYKIENEVLGQGTHFEEVLMTLNKYEAKERDWKLKKNVGVKQKKRKMKGNPKHSADKNL